MPLQAAPPPPPITGLPAPAGGFAYDVSAASPEQFVVTLDGAQTVGTGKGAYRNTTGETLRLRPVRLRIGTAPTGAALIVDVNVAGATAFSAQSGRPQIAVGQTTGEAIPARAGDPVDVGPDEVVTIDVDQVGSTVAGSDLTIVVEMVKLAPNNREGELY